MTRRGSLLVVTLWIVTILVVLVVAIARTLSLEVKLAQYRLAREQARALARSGVYVAMDQLARDRDADAEEQEYDWLKDDWAGEQSLSSAPLDGSVTVTIEDEERRLNVNEATVEQLTPLLDAADVIAALVDYRDAEKNSPLVAPEELQEIPGQTVETLKAAREFTSPYVAAGTKVNINTAPPEVLKAIGLSQALVGEILNVRDDGDYFVDLGSVKTKAARALSFDASDLNNAPLQVHSDTFTIRAVALLVRPTARQRVEAVVRRGGSGMQVLAWREL